MRYGKILFLLVSFSAFVAPRGEAADPAHGVDFATAPDAAKGGLPKEQREALIADLSKLNLSRDALNQLIESTKTDPKINKESFGKLVESLAEKQVVQPVQGLQLKQVLTEKLGAAPTPAQELRTAAEKVLSTLPGGASFSQNTPPATPALTDAAGFFSSIGKAKPEKESEESAYEKALRTLSKLGILDKKDRDKGRDDEGGSDPSAANSVMNQLANATRNPPPPRREKADKEKSDDEKDSKGKKEKKDPRDRGMMPFNQGKEKKGGDDKKKEEGGGESKGASGKGSSFDDKDESEKPKEVPETSTKKKKGEDTSKAANQEELLKQAQAAAAAAAEANKKSPLPVIPRGPGAGGDYQGYNAPGGGGGGGGAPSYSAQAPGATAAMSGDPFSNLGNVYPDGGDGPPPGPKMVGYGGGGEGGDSEGEATVGDNAGAVAENALRFVTGGESLNMQPGTRKADTRTMSPLLRKGTLGKWARENGFLAR